MAEVCRVGPDPDSRSQEDLPGGGKDQAPTLDGVPEAAFHPQMPTCMALTVPGLAQPLCTRSAFSLAGLRVVSSLLNLHCPCSLYMPPRSHQIQHGVGLGFQQVRGWLLFCRARGSETGQRGEAGRLIYASTWWDSGVPTSALVLGGVYLGSLWLGKQMAAMWAHTVPPACVLRR